MVLLLQDMADLVLLDSILLKIILPNNQDHLVKGKGLFQDLDIMHHTHTRVDRREVNKVLLCNLNGDSNSKGLLQCSNSRGSSKGDGLRCSSNSHLSNSKVRMVSNILPTTNNINTHLDLSSSSSIRDPIIRQTIPLGTSKLRC